MIFTKTLLILLLAIILVLHNVVSSTMTVVHVEEENQNHDADHYEEDQDHDPFEDQSIGSGRLLLQKKRTSSKTLRLTCDKFPRICYFKGSPGSSCCKKKCVDLLKDRMNCGKCGKTCKYNEICCNGKCVNPSFNRRHCGGCNNSCSNGEFCVLGLCNYA